MTGRLSFGVYYIWYLWEIWLNLTFSNQVTAMQTIILFSKRKWQWTFCKFAWWRHQMETFSALLALCAGNSSVTGEFPAQRPVTRTLIFSLICARNKWSSKQSPGWWFETPSCSLWRHCNCNGWHESVNSGFFCCCFNTHPYNLHLWNLQHTHYPDFYDLWWSWNNGICAILTYIFTC